MKLVIDRLWSPDLSEGERPTGCASFAVLVQVELSEEDTSGHEVFSFTVATADRLASVPSGRFVSHVLVLDELSWPAIRARLEKLLRHTEACKSWQEAFLALSPYLRADDHV